MAGAWRLEPPQPQTSADALADIEVLLLEGGAAPLAWWKLRRSRLAHDPAAAALHDAYRLSAVLAQHRYQQLAEVVRELGALGAAPVLAKGWAMARQYPQAGLRPFGDFDLALGPAQWGLVRNWPNELHAVDLNPHCPELEDRPWAEVFERSQPVPVGDAQVRVLGPEDHFRLLCFHFLRHGGWRPLWLCDIALLTEQLPSAFDWQYCLRGDHREAGWIASVIGLSQALLDMRVPAGTPCVAPPAWLLEAILRAWGMPAPRFRAQPPLRARLSHSWPDPLLASIRWSRAFDDAPRQPVQLLDLLARILGFAPRKLAKAAVGHDPFQAAHWTWR